MMRYTAPRINRRFLDRLARPLPTKPGRYFWDEWGAVVNVVKRGHTLYVTPPGTGAVEIKLTARVAGTFVEHKEA